jgi:hypothetical protein
MHTIYDAKDSPQNSQIKRHLIHSCRTKANSYCCSHHDGCRVASFLILSSNAVLKQEKGTQTKMGKTIFLPKAEISDLMHESFAKGVEIKTS